MDCISFLVLVLAAFAVGIKNTDIDEAFTQETGSNRRETHLDTCSNLTELELPANLHTLALAKCSMEDLSAIDLEAVANLSALQLRGGNLVSLMREQFVKLPHLQILELAGNSIKDVSVEAFGGLSQLWMLALNDNKLRLLNESVFRPLSELRHLDLSDNVLEDLKLKMFAGNLKLEILLLRGNRFYKLWLSTFSVLKNLTLLDLRSSGTYTSLLLSSAETLRLDNNNLYNLGILNAVSKLQARNNKLVRVELYTKAFTELDLHGNRLDTNDISELLKGMTHLQLLDLSLNFVTELPIFRPRFSGESLLLPNLRFVNLSQNGLEHLDQDSPLLSPTLTHLDVSYNRIYDIDEHTFGMVENLQYLYLQGNLIGHFRADCFYNQQRGLKELALYDNPIGNDRLCRITKFFEEAGVHILEKNALAPQCFYAQSEPVKNHSHTKDDASFHLEVHQPFKEPPTSRMWSTWSVLLFLGLLGFLALDVFLILQLRRSGAQKYCRKKRSFRVKAKFVSIEGSEILI